MKTPKRVDAHVGFFAGQSKHVLFSRRVSKRLRTTEESVETSDVGAMVMPVDDVDWGNWTRVSVACGDGLKRKKGELYRREQKRGLQWYDRTKQDGDWGQWTDERG